MTRTAIVGCGNISEVYLSNASRFGYDVVAVCDVEPQRARDCAQANGVERVLGFEEVLDDPAIEIVINLTPPEAHAPLNMQALAAGKHVYTEKPLAIEVTEGRRTLDLARDRGLHVACAPDTLLGPGYTAALELLRSGVIGRPVSALGFVMYRGPECFHPDPGFFYRRGAGPVLDMGPYYYSALVHLLGPIKAVQGLAGQAHNERLIEHGPSRGSAFPVETPTNVFASLEFESGAMAGVTMSFDVIHHNLPNLQLYGTEGTLLLPDPNTFGGPLCIRGHDDDDWREVSLPPGPTDNARGLGIADLINTIRTGTAPRAGGERAQHVLEAMLATLEAADKGRRIILSS